MGSANEEVQNVPSGDNGTPIHEATPFVHKVHVPPRTPLHSNVKSTVKETFFPDDPFRQFKNQSKRKKFVLSIFYLFPIFDWAPKYKLQYLRGDVLAGLTIASLCVPQAMSYAKLANLKPEYGLYSDVLPPFIYAVLGSSRHIVVGPVAVVSLLMGTQLSHEVNPKNTSLYYSLAFSATFFAGLVQACLGILRLGFVIDFLSHAAVVGFMAGAAITIALQQLKQFLGIKNFTTKTDIVHVLQSVFTHTHEWNKRTIGIALFFLAFLLAAKLISKKKKKLFWVWAIAPLLSVIISTAFVKLTRVDRQGVSIVGHIRKGLNPPSAHMLVFSGPFAVKAVKIGVVAAFIALAEGCAIGRSFAALQDYHIDGNKEMLAFGIMNMVSSTLSSYVTTGSFSRSAVNYTAGCNTPLSIIIMALIVIFTLKVLTPLFYYTPNCILSSIIITAVLGLIDIKAVRQLWKVDKPDFLACLGAFLGVIFHSVEIGLLIAVCISFLKVLLHVSRPHTAVLGNIPGTTVYRNVQQYPDAYRVPGVVIIRVDASIYFSNSNYIRERVLRWVHDEESSIRKGNGPPIQYVIIDLTPVMSIDTTGIHALEELLASFKKRGIQLAISNPGSAVMERLYLSSFLEKIGEEWVFLTVGQAVDVCSRLQQGVSPKV